MLSELTTKLTPAGVPVCIESPRMFKIVQGNNLAENLNGKLKNKLRSSGLLGRAGSSLSASVDSLYAAWLLMSPGFHGTCKAVQSYRRHLLRSGYSPAEAFSDKALRSWLVLSR